MPTWNIIHTIDEGGFGKVHKVQRADNNQLGALKVLKSVHTSNIKRFEREVAILKNLSHNHIIVFYDSNLNGNPPNLGPFYVMEYMDGGSLQTMMNEFFTTSQLFSKKWALSHIILPIIDALILAHSRAIYHRDLKPANLLFTTTQRNHIKVADWGIGKDINRTSIALTIGGIGTPGYCAPEQWFANSTVDGRADIYSLGIIFYQMMTGIIPQVYNNSGVVYSVLNPSNHNHPSISPQLDAAILKMISYHPNQRYQTFQELKNTLLPIYRLM